MTLHDLKKQNHIDHCLLCGGKPHCVALFKPDNPMLYGAAAGKTRFIRYCLFVKSAERKTTHRKRWKKRSWQN